MYDDLPDVTVQPKKIVVDYYGERSIIRSENENVSFVPPSFPGGSSVANANIVRILSSDPVVGVTCTAVRPITTLITVSGIDNSCKSTDVNVVTTSVIPTGVDTVASISSAVPSISSDGDQMTIGQMINRSVDIFMDHDYLHHVTVADSQCVSNVVDASFGILPSFDSIVQPSPDEVVPHEELSSVYNYMFSPLDMTSSPIGNQTVYVTEMQPSSNVELVSNDSTQFSVSTDFNSAQVSGVDVSQVDPISDIMLYPIVHEHDVEHVDSVALDDPFASIEPTLSAYTTSDLFADLDKYLGDAF